MLLRDSLLVALFSAAGVCAVAEPMTFAQALDRAQVGAPNLQAKRLGVDAAKSSSLAAGELPDPKLTVGIDNFPVSGPSAGKFGPDEMTMARVGLAQDMPNGSKRLARQEQAKADIQTAQAQVRGTAREVRLGAGLAWIDLYYARRALSVIDEALRRLNPLLDTAPSGVASGRVRPGEAVEPELWRAQLADRRSEVQAEAARARAQLVRWTGDAEADILGAPQSNEIDGNALRADLDLHPILGLANADNARADAQISAARAEARPDWGWDVAYQRRDSRWGDMVSAGVTVSLPLFATRRQDPVIAARVIEANRARVEREAALRELVAQFEGDLANHVMHHEQWTRSVETLVPLAQRRADFETSSYGAGSAILSDVLKAFTDLADAKLVALQRETVLSRDTVRLNLTYGSDTP